MLFEHMNRHQMLLSEMPETTGSARQADRRRAVDRSRKGLMARRGSGLGRPGPRRSAAGAEEGNVLQLSLRAATVERPHPNRLYASNHHNGENAPC